MSTRSVTACDACGRGGYMPHYWSSCAINGWRNLDACSPKCQTSILLYWSLLAFVRAFAVIGTSTTGLAAAVFMAPAIRRGELAGVLRQLRDED